MRFTTVVRLAFALALLAAPAQALGADTVRTHSVTASLVVPTGHPSTMRLACPPGTMALNAAVTRHGDGVVVRRSIPGHRLGDWAFRLAASGPGSRSVSAVLRCVGLRLPEGTSAALGLRTRHEPRIELDPGATATTRLGCGRAWTATGYAINAGANGDIRLAAVVPDAHGWRFTLENTGAATARGGVSARCVRSKITARRVGGGTAELRFDVTRRSLTRALTPGKATVEAPGCRGGRFTLAAGGSLDPAGSIELVTASPARVRDARWTFASVAAGDGFTGHVVCLGRGSRFR